MFNLFSLILKNDTYISNGPCNICLVSPACQKRCKNKKQFVRFDDNSFIVTIVVSFILVVLLYYINVKFTVIFHFISFILVFFIFKEMGEVIDLLLLIMIGSPVIIMSCILRCLVLQPFYKFKFYRIGKFHGNKN